MKCHGCQLDKLSQEFPGEPLSDDCDHSFMSYCLRCTLKATENKRCPFPDCKMKLRDDDTTAIAILRQKLHKSTYDYADLAELQISRNRKKDGRPNCWDIQLLLITGESKMLEITDSRLQTVGWLRDHVALWRQEPPDKLHLISGGAVLQDNAKDGTKMLLDRGEGLKDGAIVHVAVVLYDTGVNRQLNHVVFDMHWGFQPRKRDYMDSSCITFHKNGEDVTHLDTINFRFWRKKKSDLRDFYTDIVHHSGNAQINYRSRTGSTKIEVLLNNIDSCAQRRNDGLRITHLVFVVSAYRADQMSACFNPTLKFYDATQPQVNLAERGFKPDTDARSLLVCLLCQNASKNWQVINLGVSLREGDVRYYWPIIYRAEQIIKDMSV